MHCFFCFFFHIHPSVARQICENPVLLTATAPGKTRGTVSVDNRGLSNTRGEDEGGYCC